MGNRVGPPSDWQSQGQLKEVLGTLGFLEAVLLQRSVKKGHGHAYLRG